MTNMNLTGRKAEQAFAEEALKKAVRGIPQVMFVSGPSGIGKSTLIKNLNFPHGCRKIETIVPEEEIPSYGIIANLFRQTGIMGTGTNEDQQNIKDYAGYFLPEHRTESASPANPAVLLQVFFKMMDKLTENGAIVWIIEDIQCADSASFEMITNLMASGKEIPLGIIATYRNEQRGRDHSFRRIKTRLRRHNWFTEIELHPFTGEEISGFIEARYHQKPDGEFIIRLLEQTGGLPLLVSEILETLDKKNLLNPGRNGLLQTDESVSFPVPESVKDLVVLQMDDLSADARELAEIFACYGIESSFTFLARLTSSFQVIDELLEKGIIQEKQPGVASFRHELYRETIRSLILWSGRRNIYRRLALELEKQNVPTAMIADFYQKAGMTDKARMAFVNSARESCNSFAWRDAARWARKALADWPKGDDEIMRQEVLEEFVHCSKASGDLTSAVMALKEISEIERVRHDKRKLAHVFRELAAIAGLQGALIQSVNYRTQAAQAFRVARLPGEAAQEYMSLAEQHLGQLNLTASTDAADEAARLAADSGQNELLARATALQGYISSFRGDIDTGVKLAEKAVEMALGTNDTAATAETYRRLAGTIEYASNFRKAIDVYETAYRFCSANRLDYHETQCLGCMAWVLLRLGNWKRAFDTCREILDHRSSEPVSKATAHTVLAIMRSYRGEIKTARKHLAQAMRHATEAHSLIHKLLNLWPRALIALFETGPSSAQPAFSELLDQWFRSDDRHDAISGICDAASFFALENNLTELNRTIKAMTVISNLNNNPEATGILSFTIGLSLWLNKENEPAAEHFRKALEHLDKAGVPVQSAIVRFHLGLVLSELSLDDKAGENFQASWQTFKTLGIRHWCSLADKHRQTARAGSGSPVNLYGHQHISPLTNRQHEILRLLADGLSNKEIAAKVNLSTRTIDMHVRNIFERLNCRSRTEAAKIAFDTGLVSAQRST